MFVLLHRGDLICFILFIATISNMSVMSWRPVLGVEKSRNTRKKTPTMGKQLANFMTCGWESRATFICITQRTSVDIAISVLWTLLWGSCVSICSCMCMFCRSLFVLLYVCEKYMYDR